jgi:NhaA family Na+:H+ antiporter
VWGLAALAGIGFTVSLFIADLAYSQTALTNAAKMGIMAGSLAAALLGTAILFPGRHPRRSSRHGAETKNMARTRAADQA